MTITLKVHSGAIILPAELNVPEGTEVTIDIPDVEEVPVLNDFLSEFDGMATDAPADLAENHDYYLHKSRNA